MANSHCGFSDKYYRTLCIRIIVITAIFAYCCCVPEITGIRIESDSGISYENGKLFAFAGQTYPLRLFGKDLRAGISVTFTNEIGERDENCDDMSKINVVQVTSDDKESSALIKINLPLLEEKSEYFTICVKEKNSTSANTTGEMKWVHQGDDIWLQIRTLAPPRSGSLLPLWLQISLILVLLSFSGLFSGLNLGLMSLDKNDLKILQNSGTAKERRYAKTIAPLRKRGNLLLCTILLGNVLVNNTLAILLDDLTGSGMAAVVGATLAIVIFGEIIPQAMCSRYGLAVGARTIWFTKIFIVLTFPLSFPISLMLDKILGEEIGHVYNRDRLRELLKITETEIDLVKDEVNIITGALELSKKTVQSIMTKLDDVFMIEYSSVLDFETMNKIMKTGYTRIPVYDRMKDNIVALLNIKDLAFIDPDDNTPLRTVCSFYNRPITFVYEDDKLDVMLEEFKKGRSHMAIVRRVNNEGPGDPFYEIIGIVTLEDVIEEIIQSEIMDETDTITDNRMRAPRKLQAKDFSIFNQPENANYPRLSPQLALATFQFLSTSVPPFKPDIITESVLQRLIKQNVVVNLRIHDRSSDECYIYLSGKPCDYFVLILQGRVEVNIGRENLVFEGGPFMYFGVQALVGSGSQRSSVVSSLSDLSTVKPQIFVPDFTVKALTDVQFMRIRRAHYLVACRASVLERHRTSRDSDSVRDMPHDDDFSKEWQRVDATMIDGVTVTSPAADSPLLPGSNSLQTMSRPDSARGSTGSPTAESQESKTSKAFDKKLSDRTSAKTDSVQESESSLSGDQKLGLLKSVKKDSAE